MVGGPDKLANECRSKMHVPKNCLLSLYIYPFPFIPLANIELERQHEAVS